MKKILLIALPVCMLVFVSCKNSNSKTNTTEGETAKEANTNDGSTVANSPVLSTAVDYNDYIVSRQRAVYDYIFKMSDAAKKDPAAAEVVIDDAVPAISKMVDEVKAMAPFKGDFNFRDAAIPLFEFYKVTFDDSYREVININKKGAKKTSADNARINAISAMISSKEAELDIAMKTAQKAFSTANDMQILNNEALQQKVDDMNKN